MFGRVSVGLVLMLSVGLLGCLLHAVPSGAFFPGGFVNGVLRVCVET